MSSDAIDIGKKIYACQHILEKLKLHIKENNVKFIDHDALVLGFVLDELRETIDNMQNEIDDRITVEDLEK